MHIGKKIKVLRTLKEFTQEELSVKISKTRPLVSHIEQTGKVNYHTLVAILKVLGFSLEEFERFNPKESLKSYKNPEQENITILKERLIYYQKENEALKEAIASQKKIIKLLEQKK